MEKVTIGDEKVSISITRKTGGDLIVSQYAIERFFESAEEAARCIQQIVQATTLRANRLESPASRPSAELVNDLVVNDKETSAWPS